MAWRNTKKRVQTLLSKTDAAEMSTRESIDSRSLSTIEIVHSGNITTKVGSCHRASKGLMRRSKRQRGSLHISHCTRKSLKTEAARARQNWGAKIVINSESHYTPERRASTLLDELLLLFSNTVAFLHSSSPRALSGVCGNNGHFLCCARARGTRLALSILMPLLLPYVIY